MKKNCLLIIILLVSSISSAQIKHDKEYRISAEVVPSAARQFVQKMGITSKIKWFREESSDHISIEGKTKYDSRKFSIEFDTTGQIEDIEIEINKNQFPPKTWEAMSSYLISNYDKHHICKIQEQYTGSQQSLLTTASQKIDTTLILKYEVELKVKDSTGHHAVELLFDDLGNMLQRKKLITKNTDHLEY